LEYIETHYQEIENDMNCRNGPNRERSASFTTTEKTRKKREELSISACKSVKKEMVNIIVKFNV
jgi:hypothetical protein